MIIKLFALLISLAVSVNSQLQCGISGTNSESLKVFNDKGQLAEDGQWPWAAALYLKTGNQRQYFCSGILIGDQYVLTAAHCIQNKAASRLTPDQISITLGAVDSSDNNGVIVDVIKVTTHPEWNTTHDTKYDADIAIIKLNQTVKFSETIQPACLPQRDEKVFEVTGFVAGYGTYSNEDAIDGMLRYVKIPTVSQEECLWHPGGFANAASKRTFCGGDLSKSACKGDSGAGFVIESHYGAYKIIGITSAAILSLEENCKPDSYVVFTSVPKFVDWILMETGRAEEISYQVWNPYNTTTNIIPPNSIYIEEGSAKTYVARRKIGDNLVIGKFIREWNSIYIPYYRGELQFGDGIEIFATSKNHQWIPFTGTFPYNAVQGGYEGDIKLFVGRTMIDGKNILGKVVNNTIYVPYFMKELSFHTFEILVLSDESWTPYNPLTDSLPTNLISVEEGEVMTYVARRRHANNLIVGKYIPEWNSIYLPYSGHEQKFDDEIELLTTNKQHQWIPFNGAFPTNAVLGGYEGSVKLYVGRIMYEGNNIIGKVIDTTKTIYISHFSIEHGFTDSFEILVLV